MRGAPWDGLFYGFVLEVLVGVGAVAFALQTEDFLLRTLGWAVAAAVAVLAFRTIRRVPRQDDGEDPPPTGRWWFGG